MGASSETTADRPHGGVPDLVPAARMALLGVRSGLPAPGVGGHGTGSPAPRSGGASAEDAPEARRPPPDGRSDLLSVTAPARLSTRQDRSREVAADLQQQLLRSPGVACLLVGTEGDRDPLDRIGRYLNASARSWVVDTLALAASPMRVAVLVDVLLGAVPTEDLRTGERLTAWLYVLEQHSSAIALTSSPSWWRGSPSQRSRLRLSRRGVLLGATDRGDAFDVPVDDTEQQAPAAAPDGSLAVVRPGDSLRATAAIHRATPHPSLQPSIQRLTGVADPTVVDQQPPWSRWWGRGRFSEVVVTPGDVASLRPAVDELVAGAWRCSWCDKLHFEPAVCSRCHADARAPFR